MTLRPYFRPRATAPVSYTPLEVAALYDFPPGDGTGQTVAILEFGGGFAQASLDSYFVNLGVAVDPITVDCIEGAANAPGDPNIDGETYLDLCIVGALVPRAKIICIFAATFDGAVNRAVALGADVISISWGLAENHWDQASMDAAEAAFQTASTAGITICVASGDSGSGDGEAGDHVDYPAASPSVLACGGTSMTVVNGKPVETVWDDGDGGGSTGGGVSDIFPLPTWQAGLVLTNVNRTMPLDKRGVPDVAGVADPDTGWRVYGGIIGGTSAVAPMWAALVARLQAARGSRIGSALVGTLYAASPGALREVTVGDNGVWNASSKAPKDWSAACGLGSPDGADLAKMFGAP